MANENNMNRDGARTTPDSRPAQKNPGQDESRRSSERSREGQDDSASSRSTGDRRSQGDHGSEAQQFPREGGKKPNTDSGAL